MAGRHPRACDSAAPLVMGEIQEMSIVGAPKPFVAMNESTVCTVETIDRAGGVRGAIAMGVSRHDLAHGYACYFTIEEAGLIVALLRNAIADARRIEAGAPPRAARATTLPVTH